MEVEFQYFFINFGYKETVFSESRFFLFNRIVL